MGITNFWSVEAIYNLNIIILRLLQGVYNHETRLQKQLKTLQIHGVFNLVSNKVITTKNFCMDRKYG